MTAPISLAVLVGTALTTTVAFAADSPALAVGPDFTVSGAIDGHPTRVRLLPDGSSTLILNPDAAARFGMTGGWLAARVRIGPIAIDGKTQVTRYAVAGQAVRHRIGWFARPIAPGFDGALGPAAVPQPVVAFNLRPASPGERRVVLPLVDRGYGGLGTQIVVNGQPIFVEWRLTARHNGATAAAAATIAAAQAGKFTGKPWYESLAFGIERPVRRLALARAVLIGPLSVSELVVRTADYGDVSAIPDADMSEIVVTAKGKAKAIYSIQIGTDAMAGCSSLTIDKPRREIVLYCR